MEERWPAPSSEVHAHSRRPSQDLQEDFFSTLKSEDNDITRDGSAMDTIIPPQKDSAPSEVTGMEDNELLVTQFSTALATSTLDPSADIETAKANQPVHSGLAHVFVGSSFSDESQQSASDQGVPRAETMSHSVGTTDPENPQEHPIHEVTSYPEAATATLPMSDDIGERDFGYEDDAKAYVDDMDSLIVNQDNESTLPNHVNNHVHQRSEFMEDSQPAMEDTQPVMEDTQPFMEDTQAFMEDSQPEMEDFQSEKEDFLPEMEALIHPPMNQNVAEDSTDVNQLTSQLQQVHIDQDTKSDDNAGLESATLSSVPLIESPTELPDTKQSDVEFGTGLSPEQKEMGEEKVQSTSFPIRESQPSEEPSADQLPESTSDEWKPVSHFADDTLGVSNREDAWTRTKDSNAEFTAIETQQHMDWTEETDARYDAVGNQDEEYDGWSRQVDFNISHGGIEGGSVEGADSTRVDAGFEEETEVDRGFPSELAEHATSPKADDETNIHHSQNIDSTLVDGMSSLSMFDGPSEKAMEFSFFGSQNVESSQESPDFFGDTVVPLISDLRVEQEHHAEDIVIKAEDGEDKAPNWASNDGIDELGDSWAQALGPPEEGLDESWGAAFGDGLDDDGFLEDSPMESFVSQDNSIAPNSFEPVPFLPQSPAAAPPAVSAHAAPASTASTYAASAYTAPTLRAQTAVTQQAATAPMEFFADLPTTQPVRSRKPKPQLVSFPSHAPAPPTRPLPPPRTSSVPVPQSQYMPFQPPERLDLFPVQENPRIIMPIPPSTLPQSYAASQITPATLPTTYTPPQPVAPPVNTRYSPAPTQAVSYTAPPSQPPFSMHSQQATVPSHLSPPTGIASTATGLRPKSPYAPAPSAESSRPTSYAKQPAVSGVASIAPQPPQPNEARSASGPPTNTRYSPAHTNPQPPVGAQFRQPPPNSGARDYSREPPFTATPPAPNRFAPRTSSPLAQLEQRPQYDRSFTTPAVRPEPQPSATHSRHRSLGEIMEGEAQSSGPPSSTAAYAPQAPSTVLPTASEPAFPPRGPPNGYSPPRRIAPQRVAAPRLVERSMSYAPDSPAQYQPNVIPAVAPPRPRTSSPTLSRTDLLKSPPSAGNVSSGQLSYSSTNTLGQFSQHVDAQDEIDYVLPTDETAMDPLQRWKGYPIFQWGCGGTVSTSFPTRIPRYGGGQAAPKIKCVGGEVKVRKLKDIYPDQESLLTFPGPLKSKNKKKDVILWLSAKIASLEQEIKTTLPVHVADVNSTDNASEKVLLWQLIRLMVENDGVLAGNTTVDLAVRQNIVAGIQTDASPRRESEPGSVADPLSTKTSESCRAAVSEIRQHLLQAEREKAIWHAVDNKLWGHAMLISSTVDKTIWKQVIQEFVRKEVRSNTLNDTQSLAALYEVFAGNWDESVDQLVPLSARTGFQMISTSQTGQNLNSLQNINKWRETLVLILANRSNGDEQALLALGKLLISYGRVEAAHICYIFARSTAQFGGMDDPQTIFSLLGSDHSVSVGDAGRDIDAILLSEVYEFALSLTASSSASYYVPHLQAYKLNHAYALCEVGSRNEAMQYCQEIAAALKSTTRSSPYYHATFASQLDDLTKRLSQSPKDSGTGWISKPSMNKVSGSMGKWFNNFIVGDETDNASTGSAPLSEGENGPFARMAGGTPTISRQSSMVDLHNFGMPTGDIGGSRYAPNPYSSFPASEGGRNIQSSYSPSMHGTSPEQAPKFQDRRSNNESTTGIFGSPPTAPPFTRQQSNLSRYRSNDPPVAEIPHLVRPQLSAPYEPYASSMPAATSSTYPTHRPYSAESTVGPQQTNLSSSPAARSNEPVSRPDSGNDLYMGNGFTSRPQSRNRQQTYNRLSAVDESPVLDYKALHTDETVSSLDARTAPYGYTPLTSGYAPTMTGYDSPRDQAPPQTVDEGPEEVASSGAAGYGYPSGGYEPSSIGYEPSKAEYEPPSDEFEASNGGSKTESGGYEPSNIGYNPSLVYAPPATGYEPPTGSYEPPSYVPYEPQSPTTEETDPPPKKKSFMDDDDDELVKTAAALQKQQKTQRDKNADDVVRREAEADAARDAKDKDKKSSGWLGSWFGGGKKDPNVPVVHKAKLGEESSFFFDPETKKWVNRKGGATPTASASASTPPPPRSAAMTPPSRSASGTGGPPPPAPAGSSAAPPFRPSAPTTPDLGSYVGASTMGTRPESPAVLPPGLQGSPGVPGSGPPSVPPSRPGTGLGVASGGGDIDDLLGGAAGGSRRGAQGKKAKKGARYVDVMAAK